MGDLKGPANYSVPGAIHQVIYLDPKTQEGLAYATALELPWNHFSRKNIGYLYAIQQGARVIYDTDDDNLLMTGEIPYDSLMGPGVEVRLKRGHVAQRTYNPYMEYKPKHARYDEGIESFSLHKSYLPQHSFSGGGDSIFTWPRGMPMETIRDPHTYVAFNDVR